MVRLLGDTGKDANKIWVKKLASSGLRKICQYTPLHPFLHYSCKGFTNVTRLGSGSLANTCVIVLRVPTWRWITGVLGAFVIAAVKVCGYSCG
eukprot:COSAG02_NODE_3561_length_6554_cov_66.784308_6_plen_93_part_00